MKAFACYNKNESVRAESSSGGVYTLLAEYVLSKGGAVAAAVYNDEVEVEHVIVRDSAELERTRGSKYQPSFLKNTFRELREILDRGEWALFVGTPCQCAGLLAFLKKPYEKLVVCDFICHGVPSRRAWREYLKSLEKKGFSAKSVNMRDKSRGWSAYRTTLTDEKGRARSENHSDNPYMTGFVANLYLRPSCFECRFKGLERKTDITLGDFWGVEACQSEMFDDRGTSLVFVNTEKGEKIFSEISKDMITAAADEEKAVKYNPCAVSSVSRNTKRDAFFKSLDDGKDFVLTVKRLVKKPFVKTLKRKIKKILGR